MQVPASNPARSVWLALAMLLLAFCMRSVLVVIAPLVSDIQAEFGLSASSASLLIAVPVLCFALLAPIAPRLSQRFHSEPVLLLCALLIGIGTLLRVLPALPALMLGTVALGCGIAVANVLLPAFVKRHFPEKIGLMTGLYLVAMSGGATLAAVLAVPLTEATGSWRVPAMVWALPALFGAVAWSVHLRRGRGQQAPVTPYGTLWRNPLAWQVTVFMGLQSVGFYSMTAWLPTVLVDAGLSRAAAGGQLSLLALLGIPTALLVPILAMRMPDQRLLALGVSLLTSAGVAGLLIAPATATLLWTAMIGIGIGSAFSVSMVLIVLRSRDGQQAAQLSSMAQTGGYLLATLGPILVGALYDLTGGWHASMCLLLVATLVQGGAGLLAGRNRIVAGAPVLKEPPTEVLEAVEKSAGPN
ncbi:MAG: MFS transporter [Woeseia sp.]